MSNTLPWSESSPLKRILLQILPREHIAAALESQRRLTHLTQHATHESKQKKLRFMQKDTEPTQACYGGQITPSPTQNHAGDVSLLIGNIN
jgi:hypothetical protein